MWPRGALQVAEPEVLPEQCAPLTLTRPHVRTLLFCCSGQLSSYPTWSRRDCREVLIFLEQSSTTLRNYKDRLYISIYD